MSRTEAGKAVRKYYLEVEKQFWAEIKVDKEGRGTATLSAVARLCGVTNQALSKGYNISSAKLPRSLKEQGFDPSNFAKTGVPDLAVALTVSYYAKKQNALDILKSHFEKDVDFSRSSVKTPGGGRSSDSYRLTVECFKQLGAGSTLAVFFKPGFLILP